MDKVQKHNSFNTNTHHRQNPTEITPFHATVTGVFYGSQSGTKYIHEEPVKYCHM